MHKAIDVTAFASCSLKYYLFLTIFFLLYPTGSVSLC